MMQDLENEFDLLKRSMRSGLAQLSPFFGRELEVARVRSTDFSKYGTMQKLDQASCQYTQVVATLVGLLDEGERLQWFAREDATDDAEQSLAFDQSDAVAHGLRADLVARK